jgi:hypothetical protein
MLLRYIAAAKVFVGQVNGKTIFSFEIFFAVDCACDGSQELFHAAANQLGDPKLEQPADREDDSQGVHDGVRESADHAREHSAAALDSLRQSRPDRQGEMR